MKLGWVRLMYLGVVQQFYGFHAHNFQTSHIKWWWCEGGGGGGGGGRWWWWWGEVVVGGGGGEFGENIFNV